MSGGFTTKDEFNSGDILEADFATEEKQDQIISLLSSILNALVSSANSWAYFATGGTEPQPWENMETGGSYERTWASLETV